MAENKKSFLLYTDLINTISQLPDEQAGKLFKIILEYVNDKNPIIDDLLLKIAFEPIKQQLKRDLRRYEEIREKRREAGIASAESRKQTQQVLTSVESVQQVSTNSTVNDNVNVNDNVKEKKNKYIERVYFESNKEIDSAFKDYLKLRIKSKYTMTDRAIDALVKKLREHSESNPKKALSIIDNAILGKWKSFYPEKE